MKMNRAIYKIIISALVAGGASACTANYEEMNKNPYEVTDEEMERDGYAISAALVDMQGWVIPTNVNTCQFTDCLLGGSWGGYLADSNPGFNGGKFSTYNAPENWSKVMFQDIIPGLYKSLSGLKGVTTEPIPLAIAEIIQVASIHRVTDSYGPIPYSRIGENGELKAPFDSQQDVYNKMFEQLDEAIATLTEHQTEKITANADKVYGGDLVKWVKLANSLKLRLAMRIVYADEATAKAKAEEAVSHEIGVMEEVSDNAAFTGFGKDGNPFAKVMYEYNGGDSRVGADITAYMNSYNDPRRSAYFTASTFTEEDGEDIENGFYGLRSGITIPAKATAQKYSNANYTNSSPLQWMNAAEVAFLKAEGALRGWSMGGSAEDFYREGVRLSFQQWSVNGADAYLESEDTPQPYIDPLNKFTYAGAVSSVPVKWSNAGFEANLEQIITQKWIANFPLGHEAWSEYRRTGYPKLMPVVLNQSVGSIVKSDEGPRRLAYPLDEYSANGENVSAAVTSYLKGADNMATRVWWDCKK